MRILFLTPSPPRPDGSGAAIRNWHLAKAARDAGHIVDILSYGRESEPSLSGCADTAVVHALPKVRSTRERAIDTLFHSEPDLARRLRSSSFTDLLSLVPVP